ncbi:hypothetical protein [Chryseobacterium sp. R2A-55]|uniref:hypothetical protein n=1 Tax=Chryseobacterium sp. R2A-55 TaxID=2744445 RepID=UPI001F1EC988|nr:hypothetical protein [Chryseobacterium sp. R2A-55]
MSVQPIERNTVEFFLFFEKEDFTVKIDKPVGIEKAEFQIRQNQNGYGRHMTFADSIVLNFPPRIFENGFQFTKLCEYFRVYKWQCAIYLIMKVDGNEFYRARLLMSSVDTDFQYYFKCKVDVNTMLEIIEAKKSEVVNLVSDKSIDDKDITPINLVDLLTKFKKFYVDSRVTLSENDYPFSVDVAGDYGDPDVQRFILCVNLFNEALNVGNEVQVLGEIKGFRTIPQVHTAFTKFVSAHNGTEVTLRLTDLQLQWSFNKLAQFYGSIVILNPNGTKKSEELIWDEPGTSGGSIDIESLERYYILAEGEAVCFEITVGAGSGFGGHINVMKKPSIQFWTISRYEDTVTKANRLIDIGKQTVKSITNDSATIVAPRFTEPGGNFYDIYATSGLFLRQYNDQPYYATWKGFTDYIKNSFNCYFQVNGNEIFIGHETDFYQNTEVARMKFTCNDGSLSIQPNDSIMKSNFSLGYSKYEDDKASSNTIDSIHVSSEWYLANSQPLDSGKIENNIGYIADQYKIENIRRESFNKDSTKTIPNDKDIYVIDTITNDEVLMNRNDEGFIVENLFSPETAYNLRLSVKRLIIDYFSEALSNISQFTKDIISWKNTSYLNNQKAKTTADNTVITNQFEIVEAEDIVPDILPEPTMDGTIYSFDYAERVKFNTFLDLADKIINDKGYVTFYDEVSGKEVSLWISSMSYSWEDEKLFNIKGETRYEQPAATKVPVP